MKDRRSILPSSKKQMSGIHSCILACSVIISILAYSCGGGLSDGEIDDNKSTFESAKLTLIDSIMIPVMGNMRVFDFNPVNNLFLAADVPSAMIASMSAPGAINKLGIMVIDEKGNVIHQFNRSDDGPEGHGKSATDIFFMEGNNIGIWSQKGLYKYDFEGNLIDKFKDLHARNLIGSPDYTVARMAKNNKIAMAIPKNTARIHNNWDSLYLLVEAFKIYDLSKVKKVEALEEARMALLKYPEIDIYSPESDQLIMQAPARIAVNNVTDEVSVLFPEHPTLFVISTETGTLLRTIDLNPEYFGEYRELPFTEGQKYYDWMGGGGWTANSYYLDLIQIGEYTLTRYNETLSMSRINELIEDGGFRKSEQWPNIRNNHYRFRFQLLKDGQKVIPDFLLPDLNPTSDQKAFYSERRLQGQIIGGNNLNKIHVFIPNDGKEERDYQLIRTYQLSLN